MKSFQPLAPILLFVYKRLDTLKLTVTSLQSNILAEDSELFIFSDAPSCKTDKTTVLEVRNYLSSIQGFKKVNIIEADVNKGLSCSIIDGVSLVIEKFGRVIVVEDDLITSKNFLVYMNKALNFYENKTSVLSIAGYSSQLRNPFNDDVYFTLRASSWGWATWNDRWQAVDWQIKDYHDFVKDKKKQKTFNKMGSDLTRMLDRQMKGEISSWAIRFCYHQFNNNLFTVYPYVSKVVNIGFGPGATHTFQYFNRFRTELDSSKTEEFRFNEPRLDSRVSKEFASNYSIKIRFKYKLLNLFTSIFKI